MQLAPGTWRYAAPPLAVGVLLIAILPGAGVLAVAVGLAVLVFHRDPDRDPPPDGILAPADGKVSVVREEGDRLRVGVFMNVWNVHVARAPAAGTVGAVHHEPGAHRPAFSKDSDRNEKVHIDCERFEVVLIAGAFARRIHPYVEAEDRLDRGDRLGHISFGSRVDVVLPAAVTRSDLLVETGDRVRAGETRIAER